MTLTLAIRNIDRLDNGAPSELVLNRRGAMIGRSPTCDWSLPDARNFLSSRHCEVTFRDGFYTLADISTNGTLLNGGRERMTEPRRIAEGDVFLLGQYEIVAQLTGEAAAAVAREREEAASAAQAGEWSGWDAHGGGRAPTLVPGASPSGWDDPVPAGGGAGEYTSPPLSGWGAPPAGGANGGDGGGDWGPAPPPPPAAPASDWAPAPAGEGWAAPAAEAPSSGGWGASAAGAESSAGSWASGATPPPPPAPGPSTWDQPAEAQQGASGWSSAVPDQPAPPTTNDVWGAMAAGNVVDWASSGFGQPLAENRDPLGLNAPAAPPAPPPPPAAPAWAPDAAIPAAPLPSSGWRAPTPAPASAPEPAWSPPAAVTPAPGPTPAPPPPPPAASTGAVAAQVAEAFAAAAGLKPGQLRDPSAATLDRAGQLMRRLIGGLFVMVEARARAKSQMGAEATSLSFDGNNPIKFARAPEQALAQLLNPVERGFMDADKAIDDAFFDLQSHQMATLKAMQGALRATLDRFSPPAIRARAEQRGLFARIMPGAREAALWQAYEREFSGVAQGSDEAFMDTFAKEFRRAYEEQSRNRKR